MADDVEEREGPGYVLYVRAFEHNLQQWNTGYIVHTGYIM